MIASQVCEGIIIMYNPQDQILVRKYTTRLMQDGWTDEELVDIFNQFFKSLEVNATAFKLVEL